MKTTKLYSLFGVGFTLLAFNSVAIAAEVENAYPGALCQPEFNTQPIFRDADGRMFNDSGSGQNWTCPIVKHVRVAEEIEFARITVIDNNNDAGGVVSCQLSSRTAGGAFHDQDIQSTTPSQIGTFALSYGVDDPNTIEGPDGGYYYFRCFIPDTDNNGQRSGVVTYTVDENNGED